MKKSCLSLRDIARHCATEKEKPLEVQYLTRGFLRDVARHCESLNHSHSIVAGGLELTS